jgi:nicotinamide-nucleotide adenylyltransferase/phosphinothricin biosynthesis protein PhpF
LERESNKTPLFQVGCVHGRFQPFHLGHLEYVLKAYELSNILYIGLANSDPTHINSDDTAPHRHLIEFNPFPYFARMEMVLGSIQEAGANLARIRVVPFPINKPELLVYYVPKEAIHLLTIYDNWGERKKQVLKEEGFSIEVLWRRTEKITTGTIVRQMIANGQSISHLVPQFVDSYLREKTNCFKMTKDG